MKILVNPIAKCSVGHRASGLTWFSVFYLLTVDFSMECATERGKERESFSFVQLVKGFTTFFTRNVYDPNCLFDSSYANPAIMLSAAW